MKRLVDKCLRCGRFVGWYPVNFCDDQYCRRCYDALREDRH